MPFQQMSPFGSPGPSVGGINQMALMDARQRASNMEMRVLGSEAMAVELAKAKLDYRKEMQRERTRLTMREMDQAFGNKNREQRAYEMKWYGDQIAKYRELAVSDSKEARASAAELYREIASNMTASVKEMMAPFALAAGKEVPTPKVNASDWEPPVDQSGIGEPAGTTAAPASGGPTSALAPSPAGTQATDEQEFVLRRVKTFVGEKTLGPQEYVALQELVTAGPGSSKLQQASPKEVALLERFWSYLQSKIANGEYTGAEASFALMSAQKIGRMLTELYMQKPDLMAGVLMEGGFAGTTIEGIMPTLRSAEQAVGKAAAWGDRKMRGPQTRNAIRHVLPWQTIREE